MFMYSCYVTSHQLTVFSYPILVHKLLGVARPVLVVPWIVIQELDSLKVQFLYMISHFTLFSFYP